MKILTAGMGVDAVLEPPVGVEPLLHPARAQAVANALRGLVVLGRVAEKHGFAGKLGHRGKGRAVRKRAAPATMKLRKALASRF